MLHNFQAQQEHLRQRLANMPPLPPPPPPAQQDAPARHFSVLAQEQQMRDTRELCALISSILEEERRGLSGDGPGPLPEGDGDGDGPAS
jgi:hypothetical protein